MYKKKRLWVVLGSGGAAAGVATVVFDVKHVNVLKGLNKINYDSVSCSFKLRLTTPVIPVGSYRTT